MIMVVERVRRVVLCPKPGCGGPTHVRGTPPSPDIVVRYRLCLKCGYRFKTTQQPEEIQEDFPTSE